MVVVVELVGVLTWKVQRMEGDVQMDMRTEVMGHVVVEIVVAVVDVEHVESIENGVVADRRAVVNRLVRMVAVHSADEADRDRH